MRDDARAKEVSNATYLLLGRHSGVELQCNILDENLAQFSSFGAVLRDGCGRVDRVRLVSEMSNRNQFRTHCMHTLQFQPRDEALVTSEAPARRRLSVAIYTWIYIIQQGRETE